MTKLPRVGWAARSPSASRAYAWRHDTFERSTLKAHTSPDPDLPDRCYLTSASEDGLVAIVNGKPETRPWSSITSVGATIVEHGANIFVLALSFDDLQTFVVGEIEPAWASIIERLHIRLRGVEPFSSWGPRLIETPGVVDLYGDALTRS